MDDKDTFTGSILQLIKPIDWIISIALTAAVVYGLFQAGPWIFNTMNSVVNALK